MSLATLPSQAPPATSADVPDMPIYRLSVEQYHRMSEIGILMDERVELLEGWLVPKMIKNPPHVFSARRARSKLESVLPRDGWFVHSQDPVTTDESEPEPDASVVRGKDTDFVKRHPRPGDTALVVEVADSSLDRDRGVKKRIYARARIPVYWIINLVDNQVEVYTDPTGPADKPDYRKRKDYGPNDEVPVVLDGKEIGRIAVRELLP